MPPTGQNSAPAVAERSTATVYRAELDSLQARFAFMPGSRPSNPHDGAADGAQRVFIENNFDNLATAQLKSAAQTKTLFGRIDHETWKTFLAVVQVNNQTGSRARGSSFWAAAFGDR
jgi:hypothetical protein